MSDVTEEDREKAIEARKAVEAALLDPLTDIDGVGVKSAQVILVLEALGWAPAPKPVAPTEAELRSIVGNVLVNASNYPIGVTTHVLGRDMSKLINATTNALLASDLFESRAQVQAEVIDWAEAHDGYSDDTRLLYKMVREHFGLEAGR